MTFRHFFGSALVSALCIGYATIHAQSAGNFIIPSIRSNQETQFAYWNLFITPPNASNNYLYPNPPALLNDGKDLAGNVTNLTSVRLVQNGTPTCFVTSTGALYSFAATTKFLVNYPSASGQVVSNVIFQTQTGGRRFDLDNIRLIYTDPSGAKQSVAPNYKALDDPQTGAFSERLVSAFQWDLTGRSVSSFELAFSAPGTSMPLWECQLDVVWNEPFVRQLGYLLIPKVRPIARFGRVGTIVKNIPPNQESRFHLPGQTISLSAQPNGRWAHMGWIVPDGVSAAPQLNVTFGPADLVATALFAPETYEAWRYSIFLHSNSLTGQSADNENPLVSGPTVDYDGDGATNFAEFAFGGDPYTPDTALMTPIPSIVSHDGENFPAITYRQGTGGFADVSYTVYRSTDLITWQENDSAPEQVTIQHQSALQENGTTLVTVRSTKPCRISPIQFFRVVAE